MLARFTPSARESRPRLGSARGRVNDVWTEAANKQKRHPDETTEQIIERFWGGTDQKILRALLAHNAAFKFEGEE